MSVLPQNLKSEKNLNALLATTVRKLRTARGLSQEDLARLASVDRTYISGIERARRNITIATLERLIPHLSNNDVEFFKMLCEEISACAPSHAGPALPESRLSIAAAALAH